MTKRTTIRKATLEDAASIAQIHVETWETTYVDLLPHEAAMSHSLHERERFWRTTLSQPGATRTYIAEIDDRIVGFASGGAERTGDPDFHGELYALYILQAYQGQGIGRRLVRAIAIHLADDGITELLVWVLSNNPARGFYVHLGAKELRRQPTEIGSVTVDEVAFGWHDTSSLHSGDKL